MVTTAIIAFIIIQILCIVGYLFHKRIKNLEDRLAEVLLSEDKLKDYRNANGLFTSKRMR